MMYANMRSVLEVMDRPPVKRHPEAPQAGEEVMYVDVSSMNTKQFADQKQKLEKLFEE